MLARICLKKGEGLPLVFLHGFLGTSADWVPVCSHLPPWPCFGIDLPGHGQSPFTEHFIEMMPPFEKFHLIGYSMGGRLAMQYALRFPEKIASLTIASAHKGLSSEEERQKRISSDLLLAKKLVEFGIDPFLNDWYDQPLFGGFKPDLKMRKTQDPKLLASALVHYSLGKQPLLDPKDALFLVGEQDHKFRSLFPEAEIIPDSAHMVHLENPIALAAHLKKRILK